MYEVLTSPITLLCLGVVFLLISLVFFYFKRSISLLERSQMEQARVLQSFITNMEMSRQHHMAHQQMPPHNGHVGGGGRGEGDVVQTDESNEQLIDVSDDSDDETDDETDSDDDSDDETDNNENVSNVSNTMLSILEIDELDNSDVEIKVIQLQENNLEEITHELLEVNDLPTMVEKQYKMNINIIDNSNTNSDSDSDSDSDDESANETNSDSNIQPMNDPMNDPMNEPYDIVEGEPISIHKIPSVQELMTNNESNSESISTDLKALTLQKLRQIATEKGLIQTGSKPNKKEIIKLIEESSI